MHDALLLRLRVEDLLFEEADLLDQWRLNEWLALFTDDAEYLVPSTDVVGDDADPDTSLFYVFDDRNRMKERVIRLGKIGAHSEQPRSKVRHLVSNVRASRDGDGIGARASFAVWRHKDVTIDCFVGHYLYDLREIEGALKIRKKTCVLDMESLRPHGRISIIL
jgi:p-cumate 2,3-dioxygenase subunit beta